MYTEKKQSAPALSALGVDDPLNSPEPVAPAHGSMGRLLQMRQASGVTGEALLNAQEAHGARARGPQLAGAVQFNTEPEAESTPGEEARSEFEQWLTEQGDAFSLDSFMARWHESELQGMAGDSAFLERVQGRLSGACFGWLVAGILLTYSYAANARGEAMRLIGAQLADAGVARRLLQNNARVVIVPRNQRMTALAEFQSLESRQTFDGRWWAHVRGVGGLQTGGRVYVAITEENLLGGAPDAAIFDAIPAAGVPAGQVQGGYQAGYSTTTHEFGHVIHDHGLEESDHQLIEQAYEARKRDTDAAPALFEDRWVDGPRIRPTPPSSMSATHTQESWQAHVVGLSTQERRVHECYASQTDHEYFAQLTNAYLDTNTGNDPRTLQPRHNGRAWIVANEPTSILELLDRIYQRTSAGEGAEGSGEGGADGGGGAGGGVAGPVETPLVVPTGSN
ncbi:MAG: hypothetical protein CMH57_12960 [Myxococcales bacterium]|nr:hypothetical protein [Myxococcales bacterium]